MKIYDVMENGRAFYRVDGTDKQIDIPASDILYASEHRYKEHTSTRVNYVSR